MTTGTVTISLTSSSLSPVHPMAAHLTFHIWGVSDIELDVSDDSLKRVKDWSADCSVQGSDRYQSARITATARISDGTFGFTANILPIVSEYVSHCFITGLRVLARMAS